MDDDAVEGLRQTVALGCRILAARGLAEDILGHISARVDDGHLLLRCRGPAERGLLFTTPDDIRLVAARGGQSPGDVDPPGDGYVVPNELPIHVEVLARRSDAGAVVHAHPPSIIAADLAGVPLVPLVGAYNIPAARLARDGIPVFERSVLVNHPDLGRDLAGVLAGHAACVMRGHGLTTVGQTVEQAVVTALAVDSLARMCLRVAEAGGRPMARPDSDLDALPDLGTGFNDTQLWRHHVARLEHEGLGLP